MGRADVYKRQAFEMRSRYEAGEIGEVQYAEGEYIHDCAAIWPGITYGERDHWRNNIYPTYYCTHSVGPMMTITLSLIHISTTRSC